MKKNVHPKYHKVLFVDSASGYRFVCGSTLQTDAKEVFQGVEYPVSYLSISSASHPFFTGSKQLVDAEGRVEKFRKRFGTKKDTFNQDSSQEQPKQPEQQKQPEHKAAAPVPEKKAAPKAPEKKPQDKKPAEKAAQKPADKAAKPAVAKKK